MPSVSMGGIGSPFAAQRVIELTASDTAVEAHFNGGVLISMNVGSANTYTVNSGILQTRPLTLVNTGVGLCTITAGAGVTLKAPGARLRLAEQYSIATIIPDPDNTDEFWVAGALA